jgi:hypothetical protein
MFILSKRLAITAQAAVIWDGCHLAIKIYLSKFLKSGQSGLCLSKHDNLRSALIDTVNQLQRMIEKLPDESDKADRPRADEMVPPANP